ncbi:hypothetical protein M422DRAFT_251820 [Sphaerobolus stellatus SS14]|uniref:Uncharacterized protein n=1 Tax=Sphaerobolus stellatus (strain SS14) TaxID=990650 RepID=A0A0C9UPI7_SPHS4|nr:hypothetical protein M422DRAFT_251820 [Sphaerobolus stellatus SS14]
MSRYHLPSRPYDLRPTLSTYEAAFMTCTPSVPLTSPPLRPTSHYHLARLTYEPALMTYAAAFMTYIPLPPRSYDLHPALTTYVPLPPTALFTAYHLTRTTYKPALTTYNPTFATCVWPIPPKRPPS